MSSGAAAARAICDGCGKPPYSENDTLKGCSRCHKAFYHDVQCQKKHFKAHKMVCRQLAAEETSGLKIVDSSDMGLVAVATRPFAAGDLVLCERPALVFGQENGYFGLWDGYCSLSEEKRKDIMAMHHTPFAIETCEAFMYGGARNARYQLISNEICRYQGSIGHGKHGIIDEETLRSLVSIVDHNAHSYNAKPIGAKIALPSTMPRHGQMALYVLGSKIEHSCAPNLTVSTTDLGMLAYHAQASIATGERLSFSYGPIRIYEKPKKERQSFLKQEKGFVCVCTRCLGVDDCSPIWCPRCPRSCAFTSDKGSTWLCISCDWTSESSSSHVKQQMDVKSNLENRLTELKQGCETQGVDASTHVSFRKLQEDIARNLPPLHYLNPAAWDLVSVGASSLARGSMKYEGLPPSAVASLLRMSAFSQLKRIQWVARSTRIVHGVTTLAQAVESMETENDPIPADVSSDALLHVLESLVSSDARNDHVAVAQIVFQTGKDLLLAGDNDMAFRLFTRYKNLLLQWKGLNNQDRQKIVALIDSSGCDNCFGNHLLF